MEREILKQLYLRYERELYLYLYALCGEKGMAEDLVQETFLKALLALPEGHTNMRAWLYVVARNLYFNACRRQKRRADFAQVEQMQDETAQEMLEHLIAEEDRRMLYQALGHLQPRKREVLELQYFGGLSVKETAAVLKLTPEHVRVLSYRAKKELKTWIEENGL